MSKLYAILPEFAVEWEKRKLDVMAKIPQAELSEKSKREIEEVFEENREWIKQYLAMLYNQRSPMTIADGVATIHVHDYLMSSPAFIDKCMGASSYQEIAAEIQSARSNPAVKAVLIHSESGGGSAAGCVEVGRLVAELASEKETWMFTDSMCCSAAYAIAVGASKKLASPSALVGSIGTIMTFMDYEGLLSENGITAHIITNTGADMKASANPFRAPTKAEMQHLQDLADDFGQQFIDHVHNLNQRIDVEHGFRGQAVSGKEATKIGFIDGIATREEVLSALRSWATNVG